MLFNMEESATTLRMAVSEKKPRVSIGLPVYNGENYLREAIESVLAQTFKDFELIISDNASTDRTENICREYAAKDPRVRYYRNEKNLGSAKNFNLAFKLSSGEYFKWLAHDDTLEPQFLERCVELLDRDQSILLACSKYYWVNEITGVTQMRDYDHNLMHPQAYQRFQRRISHWRLGGFSPIWGLIRSQVLRETRLIQPFISADECLVLELALRGKFAQVPEYLMRLRDHEEAYHAIKYSDNWREGVKESRWFDPENTKTIAFPLWRRLWEYAKVAIRSDEDFVSKMRMLIGLLVLWPLWWTRLVSEVFFAVGLGPYCVKLKRVIVKRLRKQP